MRRAAPLSLVRLSCETTASSPPASLHFAGSMRRRCFSSRVERCAVSRDATGDPKKCCHGPRTAALHCGAYPPPMSSHLLLQHKAVRSCPSLKLARPHRSAPALGHAAPDEVARVGDVRERVPDEREELDDDHEDDEDDVSDLGARGGGGRKCGDGWGGASRSGHTAAAAQPGTAALRARQLQTQRQLNSQRRRRR